MSIASTILQLKKDLPSTVTLVAVSKFKPVEAIREAYDAGQRVFGENRPQELAAKAQVLPGDIQWHLIGHLQTNKVKLVLPYVTLIHSVDSERLLAAIDKEARAMGRTVDCLLEIHIAQETTKQGFLPEEAEALAAHIGEYPNVRLRGVMGMATFTDDMAQVRGEFRHLHDIYIHLKETYFQDNPDFKELSMGMTDDYPIAVEEGSTIIRVGSAIFGARDYNNPINVI